MIAASICILSAQAQSSALGIKLGANLARLKAYNSSVTETTDTKAGFYGGLFATLPVSSSSFFIQPELVYSTEGGRNRSDNSQTEISYLNLPVLVQYRASVVAIETGPQIGFKVAAKMKKVSLSSNINEKIQPLSLSWVMGAGLKFSDGIGNDGRYNLGLSNIASNATTEQSLKSNVFQVGVSFLLRSGTSSSR